MSLKTALVTGGTAGVGLSIVRELVKTGAFVHFIGTNEDKGARVEAELNTGGDPRCRFIKLDLSSLKAVKKFAVQFKAEVSQLDVLVNVAGVMLPRRQETSEGLEKTFALGYLGVFLLCRELTPLLAKASPSRIVNVSGGPGLVLKTKLDFDGLDFRTGYFGMRTAIKTIHAKTVLTQILAERLRDQGIDVNSFHPGAVKSDLGRNMPFPVNLVFKVAGAFMARTSKAGVYASASQEVTGVTGQLFVGKKARPLNFEQAYRDRLWTVSEKMTEQALA